MNRERIAHAIKVMERVRDLGKPFDMSEWFSDSDNPNNCGTAACFAGWCAREPEFRKDGLIIELFPGHEPSSAPGYYGDIGSAAIAKFFDLDIEDAQWLCYAEFYTAFYPEYGCSGITPGHVIDRLRYLLADGVTR